MSKKYGKMKSVLLSDQFLNWNRLGYSPECYGSWKCRSENSLLRPISTRQILSHIRGHLIWAVNTQRVWVFLVFQGSEFLIHLLGLSFSGYEFFIQVVFRGSEVWVLDVWVFVTLVSRKFYSPKLNTMASSPNHTTGKQTSETVREFAVVFPANRKFTFLRNVDAGLWRGPTTPSFELCRFVSSLICYSFVIGKSKYYCRIILELVTNETLT